MNANIQQLLEQGEGISVEFKKATRQLPDNFFDSVCAFLNRNGGTILLGVSDDKTIEGVNPNSVEMLCKNIANLSNNQQKLFPSFLIEPKIVGYEGKMLIHVFVPGIVERIRKIIKINRANHPWNELFHIIK